MRFKLHNKVEVWVGEIKHVFYNTMLKSVFEPLKSLGAYNGWLAVGNGVYENNEKTQKLSKFIKKYSLSNEILQNNIENGQLFVKQSLIIDEVDICNEYITELGLCEDVENNPTIYNYISLISDETPQGIFKKENEKLLIYLYIYLELASEGEGLLCFGKNKLISFLLGEGLQDQIFAVRGNNFSENVLISREVPLYDKRFSAEFSFEQGDDLTLNFVADLGVGETNEIVFLCGDQPIARINVLTQKNAVLQTNEYVSLESNIIDLGKDIQSVSSVVNLSTSEAETEYFLKNYASDFGDKITLPFEGLFDYQTPRFLSKDGLMLFFVKNDYVYGYKSLGYQIKPIMSGNLALQHIRKIVSFDKYVFVITKVKPFLHCYEISENKLVKIPFDLTDFEYYKQLDSLINIDITMANSGKFLMPMILSDGKGVTAYFDYNADKNEFTFDDYVISDYGFSYLLAMYKNNFSDARVMFIKGSEYSFECRVVTHYADKTTNDVATVWAYDLTYNTKQIYAKNRAIIVEKTTDPKVYIYYFPSGERYNLPLINSEVNDYFSEDLLYLIQKYSDESYKIYNIIGYDNPCEFDRGLSAFVDEKKIKDFEFFNGTLMIFVDDETTPIIAYCLKQDKTIIENLKQVNTSYQVESTKYNKIGVNNEGVKAIIKLAVSL